jgi:hypothetical protein
MKSIINSEVYKDVISDINIYTAIYSLESYVFEEGLLRDEDLKLYNDLSDKHNTQLTNKVIIECKKRIENILLNDKLFEIEVFFKPKKYNKEKQSIEYRPLHSADLYTLISIVAMLNIIMFNDTNGKRKLSDISKLLPANFYGNIPSTTIEQVFQPWNIKYKEYSENSIRANNEYFISKKYKSEVNLDLKTFYPSINPQYIFNYIINKTPVTYKEEDVDALKCILNKLLYFKVKDAEHIAASYYPKHCVEEVINKKLFYNVGLPQGLPQSYFFGNLCMIEVANITKKEFDGDAYYYVDDSIIFTDFEDDSEDRKVFHSRIDKINKGINKYVSDLVNFPETLNSILGFSQLINYEIKIHNDNNEKSTINKITQGDYLLDLNKPASTISFEIKASIDENEDGILRSKIETILELISQKLTIGKVSEQNKKLLNRLKKYYIFRLKLLSFRNDNVVTDKLIEVFYNNYGVKNNDVELFFERLEDDIFIFELKLLLKHIYPNKEKNNDFIKKIKTFNNRVFKEISDNNSYISKIIDSQEFRYKNTNAKYKTLENITEEIVEPFTKVQLDKKINAIGSIVDVLDNSTQSKTDNEFKNRISNFLNEFNNESSMYYFVYNNSVDFKRRIVNSILSKILNVQISDNTNFLKLDNRAIYYFELRLLMFIRSLNYKEKEFITLARRILKELYSNSDNEKMDLALFEVLGIFKKYIKKPNQIDDLILAHKYVNGIWKNGSKFLHFYTLHNEEHSVELINNSIRITKAVDYLTLKEEDYYVLFLACYFHDVSMVLYPNLNSFTENTLGTNIIYTEWLKELSDIQTKLSNSSEIKKFIKNSYNYVNDYFEKNIRENHPKKSSDFIKNQKDLSFISNEIRQIIANVSEAHGYEARDVYKLKSKAKSDLYDEKYLMIILRLADLLDMSKDRVSINVLRQNITHMSDNSKYHWISHMAIDNCSLHTKFNVIEEAIKIEEVVTVNIQLNTKQLTSVKASGCSNYICSVREQKDSNNNRFIQLEIYQRSENENHCKKCNFTCKWMMDKHNYLFKELVELEKYLNRNPNNIFKTKFRVTLSLYDYGNSFPPEYMDIIKQNIDN